MPDPFPLVRVVAPGDLEGVDATRWVGVGWATRDGFDLPTSPWNLSSRRWVCVGEIADQTGAIAAMEALARGVGLVIAITLTGDHRRRFEEDLAHAGSLIVDDTEEADSLTAEQSALLEGLASGLTVTAAATRANLSRRSATRRLAEARIRLGVLSTAEAVTRWAARQDRESQPER